MKRNRYREEKQFTETDIVCEYMKRVLNQNFKLS